MTTEEVTNVLKKQIPKKVLIEATNYDVHRNVIIYRCTCGECGAELFSFDDDYLAEDCDGSMPEDFYKTFDVERMQKTYSYCNACGQKLDWKEEAKDGAE